MTWDPKYIGLSLRQVACLYYIMKTCPSVRVLASQRSRSGLSTDRYDRYDRYDQRSTIERRSAIDDRRAV